MNKIDWIKKEQNIAKGKNCLETERVFVLEFFKSQDLCFGSLCFRDIHYFVWLIFNNFQWYVKVGYAPVNCIHYEHSIRGLSIVIHDNFMTNFTLRKSDVLGHLLKNQHNESV